MHKYWAQRGVSILRKMWGFESTLPKKTSGVNMKYPLHCHASLISGHTKYMYNHTIFLINGRLIPSHN